MPPSMRRDDRRKQAPTGGLQSRASLLRDLGRSPDETPIFSLPSPILPWFAIPLGAGLMFLARSLVRSGPVGALLFVAFALAYAVALLFPRKLVVGEDGILLVWIGSRFIPYRDIAYVETYDGFYFDNPGINVALRSGRALDFATSIWKGRWAERDALLTLIRVSRDAEGSERTPRAPLALARADRAHLAWARALRAIGTGAYEGMRTSAVPADELLAVAESHRAPLVDRAAAFVALSASQEEETIHRLRVALERTAAPDATEVLRGVLDAGENEDALAAILERAEKR